MPVLCNQAGMAYGSTSSPTAISAFVIHIQQIFQEKLTIRIVHFSLYFRRYVNLGSISFAGISCS